MWCAASTHKGEENLIVKLHKNIKRDKKIINSYNSKTRKSIKKILKYLANEKLRVITHSSKDNLKDNTDIYIVDTYGEVSKFYNISNSTFMGGSIVKHGGQNPLEPARLGNYIISGPNIENFKEIYAFLKKKKVSKTTLNIYEMKNIIENKINKKISKKVIKKIFDKGNKILDQNYFYVLDYIK